MINAEGNSQWKHISSLRDDGLAHFVFLPVSNPSGIIDYRLFPTKPKKHLLPLMFANRLLSNLQ